ncbi:MAG: hypothetical protein JWN56_2698 [Sphingobacteriales bacterium]|nr:hypothetical protein [Sphingobacteriales bacterium]
MDNQILTIIILSLLSSIVFIFLVLTQSNNSQHANGYQPVRIKSNSKTPFL